METAWLGLAGLAGVTISLLMGLWVQHVRERPVYERPSIMIRPGFWWIWMSARGILLLLGGFLLARASLAAAGLLALALIGAWSWKRHWEAAATGDG